jgi:hypothetical protein
MVKPTKKGDKLSSTHHAVKIVTNHKHTTDHSAVFPQHASPSPGHFHPGPRNGHGGSPTSPSRKSK